MLDLSELMTDPDFCQTLTVIRRTETVGSDGLVVITETPISPAPVGSMQAGANPDTLRTMDLKTNEQVLTVYTKFPLRDVQQGSSADIVVFLGARYQVYQLNQWTQWGAGWIQAVCKSVEAIEPQDA